uniref:U2 small nuclear ribonucleoprotein A n=1 Tax=Cajanus cajan TaxID=3821 RepID=A0A151U8F5_CAJCA|nr:U2 small nuclear ribonucleoprotein A' [Cajanus cajan]
MILVKNVCSTLICIFLYIYKVRCLLKIQDDTIDLSDNEIFNLENVPYLNRWGTKLINHNRITRINPNIGEFLLKLHALVVTNNRIVNLIEIDRLASLPKLQFLSLLDNNITKKANYRLYVINKLKSLRFWISRN